MHLERITIQGFRCFGEERVTLSLRRGITALVGSNASGKTALLHALAKVFGIGRAQRTIERSDFHLAKGVDPDSFDSKHLVIDVRISFPELSDGTASPETVAPVFRHMMMNREEEHPVCRIRLEADWEDDGTLEGHVTQHLYWVHTLAKAPSDEEKSPVTPGDRGLIQLYYTPANRDAGAQVRATTGALAARLLRAISWSENIHDSVDEITENLTEIFEGEPAIVAIGDALQKRWRYLYDEKDDTNPRLSLTSRRFQEVINKLSVIFEDSPDGRQRSLDALSEGQQSLFYFALVAAVFDMERKVLEDQVEGFHTDLLSVPALSIFALEEPENHLAPFYLSRLVRQFRSLTKKRESQAIITSHSPAVLSRIGPSEVRFCRHDRNKRASSIKRIKLPPGKDEKTKFVRSALRAFPELYFARFVCLVEGDSERIVLPRLAAALGLAIDPSFVSIVPLGGRHVGQFWKLLSQMEIPYATLLDLDLGRAGGGFGRIKTVLNNLISIDVPKEELLEGGNGLLSEEDFEQMHTWQNATDLRYLRSWIESLKSYNVFFLEPLDLDLAMLDAFPEAYESTIHGGGGPRTSDEDADNAVLGTGGPGPALYDDQYKDLPRLFPSYRYHFLTRSKPATHLAALTYTTREAIRDDMPPILTELLNHISDSIRRN